MAAEIPTYDEAWLKLLHYHKTLGGYRGLVENQDFYISPDGRDNPIAEFAAEIKAFADGTENVHLSRRVEFRTRTNADQRIVQILDELKYD